MCAKKNEAVFPLKRLRNELETNVKSMDNFDPDKSLRTKRKALDSGVFDEHGRYKVDGSDRCDCLSNRCTGCHFPCPKWK